jgi:hypothetical protein
MTDEGTNPDNLPNGSGNGDTSDTADDTTSGGTPDQPWSAPTPPEGDDTDDDE